MPVTTYVNTLLATNTIEKERDLKPVEPEMPEVEWNRRESEGERADEERTGRPVDAMNGKTGNHVFRKARLRKQLVEQPRPVGAAESLTIARFMPLFESRFRRLSECAQSVARPNAKFVTPRGGQPHPGRR